MEPLQARPKRDLLTHKRDLLPHKRDLLTHKRDLLTHTQHENKTLRDEREEWTDFITHLQTDHDNLVAGFFFSLI